MKKLIFIFLVCLLGCKNPNVVPRYDYTRVKDSLTVLIQQNGESALKVLKLTDSINVLNSGVLMTKKQHDEIINYERLLKYYNICKKNPSQWIFYKGWSTRVFEQ